jgi:hypothetical protein
VRRNGDIFSECSRAAKLGAGNSQDLAMVAEIYVATTAVVASPAENGRVEGDSVAFRKSAHSSTERSDCSGSFVSHDDWRNPSASGTIVAVDVAPADSTGSHTYKNFVVAGCWVRKIGNFKMLVLRKQKGFHGSFSSFFKARLPVSTE